MQLTARRRLQGSRVRGAGECSCLRFSASKGRKSFPFNAVRACTSHDPSVMCVALDFLVNGQGPVLGSDAIQSAFRSLSATIGRSEDKRTILEFDRRMPPATSWCPYHLDNGGVVVGVGRAHPFPFVALD